MIEIDGSYGEGGGQIIRNAVSMSALSGKSVHIYNIRASRKPDGLQPQHVKSIEAVAKLCNAKTEGVAVGSKDIVFTPGKIESKDMEVDIGTAGSITLVLQAILPAAIFSGKSFAITIKGGTNVIMSPPIEYFGHVLCRILEKFGAKVELEIKKYGFYPKGRGEVKIKIYPSKMSPIKIDERGKFLSSQIFSISSKDLEKAQVAQRQADSAREELKDIHPKLYIEYVDSVSTGSCIHAQAMFENTILGAETMGQIRIKSEVIGKGCAELLRKEIDSSSTVDVHMADQLIPYMGFLGGEYKVREITSHLTTNIWVTEKFLPCKFGIEGNVVSCKKLMK